MGSTLNHDMMPLQESCVSNASTQSIAGNQKKNSPVRCTNLTTEKLKEREDNEPISQIQTKQVQGCPWEHSPSEIIQERCAV